MSRYIHFTDEQKIQANNVDLVDFVQKQGERIIKSGKENRLESDHSITINGNCWYDHSEKKGGHAIEFVKYFYNKTFPEAMTMLLGDDVQICKPKDNQPKKTFKLPPRNNNMKRVFGYLVSFRKIDSDVLNFFVNNNLIYESCEPSKNSMKNYHNVVFLGKDEHNKTVHAHKHGLHSSGENYKGNIESSNSDYTFHYIGKSNNMYVFESPIDLLSYISLNQNENWQNDSYIALCGVSEKSIIKQLNLHDHLKQVTLCLDNDDAGQKATERIIQLLTQLEINTQVIIPQFKDFNEDLQNQKKFEITMV